MTSIELDEALELLAAVLDRIGRTTGRRVLVIKGAATEAHHLRRPRSSADLDVLVARSDWDTVVSALTAVGWQPEFDPDRPAAFENHSMTMVHEFWPCELDVHRYYPGFLRDADEVFDRLWEERVILERAGRPVAATGPLGSTLIAALHALREIEVERNREELAQLVTAVAATGIDVPALQRLAVATGSAAPLAPLWAGLGVSPPRGEEDPEALRQWAFRTEAGRQLSLDWVAAFREAPVWRWPALVFRALWPTDRDIQVRSQTTATGLRLLKYRRQRLRDGLRALPGAVRLVWKYRR